MLNNKRVLCIGNNTIDTDLLTSNHAELNLSVNYGLIDTTSGVLNKIGFYHTSFADFDNVTNFLALVKQFDHVIFFKQPASTYDNINSYNLTNHSVTLIQKRLMKPVDIIDAET